MDLSCLAQCHGDHSGQDFEADRKHLGETLAVSLITYGRAPCGRHIPGDVVEADEPLIAVYRRVGDCERWLAIVNDSQHGEVSLESATRLRRELAALIEKLTVEPALPRRSHQRRPSPTRRTARSSQVVFDGIRGRAERPRAVSPMRLRRHKEVMSRADCRVWKGDEVGPRGE